MARLAFVWSVVGLVVQAIFAIVIAPALGETLDFALPGRGPTLAVTVDTGVVAVLGIVVSLLAVAVAVAAVMLASRGSRGAYAAAVLVCIVVPGFVALVTVNGLVSLATGGETSTGTALIAIVAGVVGFALGGISVAQAPKFADAARAPAEGPTAA